MKLLFPASFASEASRFAEVVILTAEGRPADHGGAGWRREDEADEDVEGASAVVGGVVRFAPTDETMTLYVMANACRPMKTTVSGAAGRSTLRFPAGETLFGRILIDEAPPSKGWRYALEGWIADQRGRQVEFRDDFPEIPHSIDAAMVRSTGGTGAYAGRFVCDAEGRVRFGGLPVGWRGRFRATRGFVIEQPEPDG